MTQSGEAITNVRTGQKMFFRKTGRETNGTLLEIECFNPSSDIRCERTGAYSSGAGKHLRGYFRQTSFSD